MICSTIRFGLGVTREIGKDLRNLHTKRTLVITDTNVAKTIAFVNVIDSMKTNGISFDVFDRVHVEPTDASMCIGLAF
jgi:hydroxyacid-oxoacid transhydrogenase